MIEKVLIIRWVDLPNEVKSDIADNENFHNDCFLEIDSEFEPRDLDLSAIKSYWQDQKKTNNFKGTFEGFVKKYNLKFEMWLIEQKLDLDVDRILVKVCW